MPKDPSAPPPKVVWIRPSSVCGFGRVTAANGLPVYVTTDTLGRVLLTPLNFSDFSELVTNR